VASEFLELVKTVASRHIYAMQVVLAKHLKQSLVIRECCGRIAPCTPQDTFPAQFYCLNSGKIANSTPGVSAETATSHESKFARTPDAATGPRRFPG